MNTKHAMLYLALSALIPTTALAQDATDLLVNGRISPSACLTTVAGNGNVDVGNVSRQSIDPTTGKRLPNKDIAVTVTCPAATRFAFGPIDNRDETQSVIGPAAFGLGLHAGTKIGYYIINVADISVDSARGEALVTTDDGTTWSAPSVFEGAAQVFKAQKMGFTPAGGAAVEAITTMAATYRVTPYLAPGNTLSATDEIALDGSMTFEMKYL